MNFELTPELVDQIVFGMENQEKEYLIDLERLEVVAAESGQSDESERYMKLPEWNSASGFQLMERFVASLRNPVFREVLRDCLAGGKGVFRRFKNALKDREDIERLWFSFKEREMKRRVVEWYNSEVEALGLETVSFDFEDDETNELVLTDFQFRRAPPELLPVLRELDRDSFDENLAGLPESARTKIFHMRRAAIEMQAEDIALAETPDGDLAAFLWASEGEDDPQFSIILQIYVLRDFRGLGLAKTMLERYCTEAFRRGVQLVLIETGGSAQGFQDALAGFGFAPLTTGMTLDLHAWGLESLYP